MGRASTKRLFDVWSMFQTSAKWPLISWNATIERNESDRSSRSISDNSLLLQRVHTRFFSVLAPLIAFWTMCSPGRDSSRQARRNIGSQRVLDQVGVYGI